ncbi:hypothetical protein MTO96_012960 [Rhipicephalus appendiculatus]
MFKKFDEKEHVSGITQLKSSVQKAIKGKILEQFPLSEDYINQILPKKDLLRIVKCHDHVEILINGSGELLFFRQRAIRFVLSGANIMCPGLTSPGAKMTRVPKGTVVAIMAEGKEHSLAVGFTTMSTDDIASINKGIGVENVHYLNDGLWHMKPVK